MDSGDMTEAQNPLAQPAESVPAPTEEQTPAQGQDTEQSEFYVEVEGDQQDTPNEMSDRQTRAAWKEERRKRKEKTELANAEKERADRLERELQELKTQVNNVSRGDRPDPFDFSTKEEFYAALDKWQNHGKPAQQQQAQQQQAQQTQQQGPVLSDDQEWHLHQSEMKIKDAFKDYGDARERVVDQIRNKTGNAQFPVVEVLTQLSHTFDADPAKAFYALDKNPALIDKLMSVQTQPEMGRILREAESKIKVRERKPVDSTPEPNITSSGPISVIEKEIKDAEARYYETGKRADYDRLRAARQKKKVANNG